MNTPDMKPTQQREQPELTNAEIHRPADEPRLPPTAHDIGAEKPFLREWPRCGVNLPKTAHD